ncbi:hypothetical protein KAX06_03530 [candidate division WOR-3 bacterium]|nr:hypothetical protein [candidate division WOR-3 bacterium]
MKIVITPTLPSTIKGEVFFTLFPFFKWELKGDYHKAYYPSLDGRE